MFSIITPTYNHGSFLKDCIESVLRQTFEHWEMLIIDDGSTDQTEQLVQQYAKVDARIKYVRHTNKGIQRLAETYNTGLRMAHYPYVAILEGDDMWYPHKLQVQADYIKKHPDKALVFSYADEIYGDKLFKQQRKLSPQYFEWAHNIPRGSFIRFYMHHMVYPLTVVIKKDPLERIGGFLQKNNQPAVDTSTFLELSAHYDFGYIDDTLGIYRRSVSQVTRTHTQSINLAAVRNFEDFYKTYLENTPLALQLGLSPYYFRKYEDDLLLNAGLTQVRILLKNKQFKDAQVVLAAVKNRLTTAKLFPFLRWIAAWLLSYLRLDFELFNKLLGRKYYP